MNSVFEHGGPSVSGAAPARRLRLECGFAAGDHVLLTAAVRDLHRCHPGQFLVEVVSPFPGIWEHNPHLVRHPDEAVDVEKITCDYPLIDRANEVRVHALHGFIEHLNQHLGLSIRLTELRGDIHLSESERSAPSMVEQLTGQRLPYWLVSAGGKFDLTIKWWETERWQAVVDHFQGRICFVQVGEARHFHPALRGVLDLRGWTNLRQLVHLVHHAAGVVCPVTCLMHLAAAVERPAGQTGLRPCVVVAGGREPAEWEAYPGHDFLHTVGALPCCAMGGCWRRRTVPLGDGHANDAPEHLCLDAVGELPRCMDRLEPAAVIQAIERSLAEGRCRELTVSERDSIPRVLQVASGTALDRSRVTRSTARLALKHEIQRLNRDVRGLPGTGRGIVTAAEGLDYVGSAWVGLRMLRRFGCGLPVEIWHAGTGGWKGWMTELFRGLGAEVRSTVEVDPGAADLHRFGLKPFALVHSRFREVLWIDADSMVLRDPGSLFDLPVYRDHGAVFWPDVASFPLDHSMWRLTGVRPRVEPEVQGGEILVDRWRCGRALRLALWFNEQHRFFYRHVHGDKDTYRFAWHRLGQPFAMPSRGVINTGGVFCQHDFNGVRLFQHRVYSKWRVLGENPPVDGMQFEEDCLALLGEFRELALAAEPGLGTCG